VIPSKNDILPYVDNRKEAAKKFEVTEKTIVNWMKFHGLYKPKENYGCGKLNLEKACEIRKLYESGRKMKELASIYNVTFSTISRVIHNVIYAESKSTATVSVIYNINVYAKSSSFDLE
jgi:hypothetical protein